MPDIRQILTAAIAIVIAMIASTFSQQVCAQPILATQTYAQPHAQTAYALSAASPLAPVASAPAFMAPTPVDMPPIWFEGTIQPGQEIVYEAGNPPRLIRPYFSPVQNQTTPNHYVLARHTIAPEFAPLPAEEFPYVASPAVNTPFINEDIPLHELYPQPIHSEPPLYLEPTEPKDWLALEQTTLNATWIPGDGDNFGLTELRFSAKIESPRLPFLVISPRYEMSLLNGPRRTDLPGSLHHAGVSFTGRMPLSERVFGIASVTPGVFTDYHNTSSQSFRTTGSGMVIFAQSEQLQWFLGVIYINREDVSLLPFASLNWSPDERNRFEFSFPRPRYLRRVSKQGDDEQWWYLMAEFGGGSWAIQRANGDNDVVTLKDYRLITGMEYQRSKKQNWFWEAGLVLGRGIEYSSGVGDFDQNPSVMARIGSNF